MMPSDSFSTCIHNATGTRDAIRRAVFRLHLPLCVLMLVIALVLPVFLAGCQTPRSGSPASPEAMKTLSSSILQAGDVVRVHFPQSPELNQSQKIRVDGKITLPHVGEVQAAGKTPGRLQDDLAAAYARHLTSPQVAVIVESSIMAVYVSGAVNRPGKVQFDRPMSVLEAIMEAGGLAYVADTRRVRVIRQADGQYRTEYIDLRPVLGGRVAQVEYVRPGDVIFVPEKAFNF